MDLGHFGFCFWRDFTLHRNDLTVEPLTGLASILTGDRRIVCFESHVFKNVVLHCYGTYSGVIARPDIQFVPKGVLPDTSRLGNNTAKEKS